MNHWNHRVVHRVFPVEFGEPEGATPAHLYGVHEAYYDDAGKVFAITENPDGVSGNTIEELREDIERHRKALDAPVLEFDNIPEEGAADPAMEAILEMRASRAGEAPPSPPGASAGERAEVDLVSALRRFADYDNLLNQWDDSGKVNAAWLVLEAAREIERLQQSNTAEGAA